MRVARPHRITKHLHGKHDQKTYGRGGVGRIVPSTSSAKKPGPPREVTMEGVPPEVAAKVDKTWGELADGQTMVDADANLRAVFNSAIANDPAAVEEGAAWYAKEHDDVAAIGVKHGMSTEQVAAVASACSPGQRWEGQGNQPGNKGLADLIIATSRDYPDLSPEATVALMEHQFRERTGVGISMQSRSNLVLAAKIAKLTPDEIGEQIPLLLTGCKRRSFYNNLRDPNDPMSVTIDSHMFDAARGGLTGTPFIVVPRDHILRGMGLYGPTKGQYFSDEAKTKPVDDLEYLPKDYQAYTPKGSGFTAQTNISRLTGSPTWKGYELGASASLADSVRSISADWNRAHPERPYSPAQVQAIIWTHQMHRWPDFEAGNPQGHRNLADIATRETVRHYNELRGTP